MYIYIHIISIKIVQLHLTYLSTFEYASKSNKYKLEEKYGKVNIVQNLCRILCRILHIHYSCLFRGISLN